MERSGGSYDKREVIALTYAISVLQAADRAGIIPQLEQAGLDAGDLEPGWVSAEGRRMHGGEDAPER
jgi:hypothetical protein